MKCLELLSSMYKGRSWGNAQATKPLKIRVLTGLVLLSPPLACYCHVSLCSSYFSVFDLIVLSQGHHSRWMRAHPNDLTLTCSPLMKTSTSKGVSS